MAVREPVAYIAPEEYLRREREAEFKSEYLDGHIYAMAGASPTHNAIAANIIANTQNQLRGKPCRTYAGDLKICTPGKRLFAYPDLSVLCAKPAPHDEANDVVLNPTVLVEVLSPSTQRLDRGAKWLRYQEIATLQDYLLVAQDEARVERYARQSDGSWRYTVSSGTDATISLESIGVTLELAEVYLGIEFPTVRTEPPGEDE